MRIVHATLPGANRWTSSLKTLPLELAASNGFTTQHPHNIALYIVAACLAGLDYYVICVHQGRRQGNPQGLLLMHVYLLVALGHAYIR